MYLVMSILPRLFDDEPTTATRPRAPSHARVTQGHVHVCTACIGCEEVALRPFRVNRAPRKSSNKSEGSERPRGCRARILSSKFNTRVPWVSLNITHRRRTARRILTDRRTDGGAARNIYLFIVPIRIFGVLVKSSISGGGEGKSCEYQCGRIPTGSAGNNLAMNCSW